jgi:hypothetical protein
VECCNERVETVNLACCEPESSTVLSRAVPYPVLRGLHQFGRTFAMTFPPPTVISNAIVVGFFTELAAGRASVAADS